MFYNYSSPFPFRLFADIDYVPTNNRSRFIRNPMNPKMVIRYHEDWVAWSKQLSNLWYIDDIDGRIHFKSKEDHALYTLAWGHEINNV